MVGVELRFRGWDATAGRNNMVELYFIWLCRQYDTSFPCQLWIADRGWAGELLVGHGGLTMGA
jgi:hypothetical protein